MIAWPVFTMRCECCCRPSDYCFWGPNGWVCIRCDMRGIYDRASYLQREGLAEGSNSMKTKRYATFTTERCGQKATRTFSYWKMMFYLAGVPAITYWLGYLVGLFGASKIK